MAFDKEEKVAMSYQLLVFSCTVLCTLVVTLNGVAF